MHFSSIKDSFCNDDVFDRQADRLEEGNLFVILSTGPYGEHQLTEISHNVALRNDSIAHRDEEITGFLESCSSEIHEDSRSLDRFIINLTGVGLE
jgi:hypothetical protein